VEKTKEGEPGLRRGITSAWPLLFLLGRTKRFGHVGEKMAPKKETSHQKKMGENHQKERLIYVGLKKNSAYKTVLSWGSWNREGS